MPINLRWVGEADYDRVARTRLRCYAPSARPLERYRAALDLDPRSKPGDFLLAEDGIEAIGTATSMSFNTWVRGSRLSAQGVAWVGAIRTRRRGGTANEPGIASQMMTELLRKARERENVVSYLMPFRASFYEHFGYGLVERRMEWTIPISIFPKGPTTGLRFAEPEDRPAIEAGYQLAVEGGQCDLERSPARWADFAAREAADGFEVIDRPDPAGPVLGYLFYDQFVLNNKDYLRVQSQFAANLSAFRRQLHVLAGLKDQYLGVQITLPNDIPLHWHLTERQLPHRLVNHGIAEAKPITRLQARVLDHRRLLEALHLPEHFAGEAVVAVHETEKSESRFRLTIEGGRVTVQSTEATPQIECPDTVWAAIALGDMTATRAAANGLIDVVTPGALATLDALSVGAVPFCREGF